MKRNRYEKLSLLS